MDPKINATLLLSAYACCSDHGSEPRYGWNYLLLHARSFRQVILVTSILDHRQVSRQLTSLGIRNVTVVAVGLPFGLEKLRKSPVGGIHLHYWLWLRKALRIIGSLPERIDFAHHITFGSLQFGSPLYRLSCPFIFGPVGGGQVTNKVFYPLMGKARRIEKIRDFVSYLCYRWDPLFKGTLRNATLIYCTNNETKAAAIRYLPAAQRHKVQVMLDTILDDRFLGVVPAKTRHDGRLRAVWVGRLIPRKGIEILLNVARLLKDDPFTLTMAGDGPMRPMVLDYIRANSLQDTIDFAGLLDQRQLLEAYRQSDLLLFLSYRDSAGLQIMEAFSQGLPVVSFDQFGASILIGPDTGVKIPVEGSLDEIQEHIVTAIRRLIRDPQRLADMGNHAVSYAQGFTWSRRGETLLSDIKPLLNYEDADRRLERV